jgi:hypothetical protein
VSYVRWGERGSDVYVYARIGGGVTCAGCESAVFRSADDLVGHLRRHVAAGWNVPGDLLDPRTYDPADFVARPQVPPAPHPRGDL